MAPRLLSCRFFIVDFVLLVVVVGLQHFFNLIRTNEFNIISWEFLIIWHKALSFRSPFAAPRVVIKLCGSQIYAVLLNMRGCWFGISKNWRSKAETECLDKCDKFTIFSWTESIGGAHHDHSIVIFCGYLSESFINILGSGLAIPWVTLESGNWTIKLSPKVVIMLLYCCLKPRCLLNSSVRLFISLKVCITPLLINFLVKRGALTL